MVETGAGIRVMGVWSKWRVSRNVLRATVWVPGLVALATAVAGLATMEAKFCSQME